MAGILALLARPKGGAEEEPEESAKPDSESDEENRLFRLAVQAIKDGDEDAAVEALRGAVEACVQKSEAGEYEPEE